MLKCHLFPKILFPGLLALSVSTPALATYTITADATIDSSTTGLSNNSGDGIQTSTSGNYTVMVNGSVDVSDNDGYGIFVLENTTATFKGGTSDAAINISNTGRHGISSWLNSTLVFENVSLIVDSTQSSTDYSFCSHYVLTFKGDGENTKLEVVNSNTKGGLHLYHENEYSEPEATITDTNVNISDNAKYGILINSKTSGKTSGTLTISSAEGKNTLDINNNGYDGISVKDGAIDISGMNINITENGSKSSSYNDGIDVTGKLTVAGVSDANNTMVVNENVGNGILIAESAVSDQESGLSITDMDITLSNNGGAGLSNTGVTGTITSTDGAKSLVADGNTSDGMVLAGDMTFTNMNIQTNSNGSDDTSADGIENTKNLTITGNGETLLQSDGNGGAGILTNSSGNALSVNGMNVELTNNTYGLTVEDGTVEFTGVSGGSNSLTASSNTNDGISISGSDTSLTVENMDVKIADNGGYGLKAENSTVSVSSATGRNKMVFDNNVGGGFYTTDTDVTIDKTNVYISDTQLSDGDDSSAIGMNVQGVLTMTGNGSNVLNVSGNSVGLNLTNSESVTHETTVKNYNLTFKNNTDYGVLINDTAATVSSTNKNNTMAFSGNGKSIYLQSEGDTNATDTTLDITGMKITSSDAVFAAIEGSDSNDAELTVKDSTLRLTGSNQTVYDLNKGAVTLSNVQQTGTNPAVLVNNTDTSTLTADKSSLVGSVTDNGQLTVGLSNGSSWKMLNDSNIYVLSLDNSKVDLRSNTTGKYNTLTIADSYEGDNATVYMNTDLDAEQLTDQIVLQTGTTVSGTTNLHITNTAAFPSYGTFIKGDGVKVVDAQGTTVTGADTFDLVGKRIDSGLYIQELYYQNLNTDNESWYIRTATEDDGGGNKSTNGSYSNGNKPKPTDLTNTIASMPAVALSVIKTINSELRNRLGELRSNNPKAHNGAWARGYYKSLEVDENIKNEMDIYGVEAGYDHLIAKDRTNRTYLGIMAGYAWADKVKIHQTNGHDGKGDTTVPSVGAYLTWINKNGWYTDSVIRGFYTQTDVTNYSAQGLPITYDADNWAVTGSFEFGRRTALYQNGRNGFILEPKAQVVYTYMPEVDHKTNVGQKIKYDSAHSLVTRAALMAAYRRTFANGMAFEPYIQAGVAYEWLGETDVHFLGSDFTSDVGGATFEGAIGMNARLSRGWHLYGDVNLEQGSVYKSWGGHLGLRYNF